MSGSSRNLPIGWRASAMTLALVASRMNFIQSSVRICSLSVASKPAFRQSASNASPRGERDPSSSPKIMRMKVPTWRMTPGATIEALICATPPITACLPRIGTSRSGASMPFCNGITAVRAPTSGLMCRPALSTSHSFTQNSTISTGPTAAGSSVAWVGCRWMSPRGLSTLRPLLFIAARWAPRAMKVTSPPAFASAAPNPPPTPPAPTTAIRI